ncbi:MAG: hypothetical protein JWQ38_919 [Flavipsychrobacter sp.]|nr:hypothetical protein [Flavipsychrobacter sp.]
MSYKTILLTLFSLVVIMSLYSIPAYNNWMENKIFTISNLSEQMNMLGIEDRRDSRYGYSYMVFKDIAGKIGKLKDATLLIPPQKYLDANAVKINEVEPSLFYYYTGVNAVSVMSPKVLTATWALISDKKGQVSLIPLSDKKSTDSLVTFLKKYQPKQP